MTRAARDSIGAARQGRNAGQWLGKVDKLAAERVAQRTPGAAWLFG